MVNNILVLRFGNVIFEALWTREHIDHVQVWDCVKAPLLGVLLISL